jgi:hypothetical protein
LKVLPISFEKGLRIYQIIPSTKARNQAIDAGSDELPKHLACLCAQIDFIKIFLVNLVFDAALQLGNDIKAVFTSVDDVDALHLDVLTHWLLWQTLQGLV